MSAHPAADLITRMLLAIDDLAWRPG